MPPASPEPGAAPLLTATLLAPAAQALAPRRHLRLALAAVLCLPLGLLALAACLTSTVQCPSRGALLYPACENAGDGNGGAPLGIALLACWPGWSRADRQGAVPALAGTVRDATRQENPWSPHGALMERPLNLQSAGQGPAGCSGSTRPGTGAAGQAGWAEDRRPPPGPAHGRCLRPRPRFWHPALRRTSGSPSRGQDLAPAACPAARDW